MPLTKPLSFLAILLVFSSKTAGADECQLDIEGNDAMQFNLTEMSAPSSCKEITVKLIHTGKLPANVMGHNWVLSKTADMKDIATIGMNQGLDNHYLPSDDARVLASTDVIGGGATTEVTFSTESLNAGEEYTYFCSFPGHWSMMKGILKLTP